MKPLRFIASAFALVLSIAAPAVSCAADVYPSKPIRFVVPVPPGNAGDIIARLLAEQLSKRMGQPVIVENRPGAGGNIGGDFVAKAPADGYTVLLGSSGLITTNAFLYKLPFDPIKDLIPVTQIFSAPPVLVVGSKSPFKTVQELIEAARKEPGKYSFASYGSGHISHISGELFKRSAGINLIHVPYKNSPLVDVMSGQVDMVFDSPLLVLNNKETLRPLANASVKRNPRLPNVPAMGEVLPGFEMTGWLGAFVPARTPPEVVAALNREMAVVINSPEFKKRIDDQALNIGGNTPEDFAVLVRTMSERIGELIRTSNIKAD